MGCYACLGHPGDVFVGNFLIFFKDIETRTFDIIFLIPSWPNDKTSAKPEKKGINSYLSHTFSSKYIEKIPHTGDKQSLD